MIDEKPEEKTKPGLSMSFGGGGGGVGGGGSKLTLGNELTTTFNLGSANSNKEDNFPKRWESTVLPKKEDTIKIPEEDSLQISIPSRGGQMKPPLRNRGIGSNISLTDQQEKKQEPLRL